jgi:hypothetical protein
LVYRDSWRLKLIACDVFMREICHLIARAPHVCDLEFTEKDAHNRSDTLRELLQQKIDASCDKGFEAVLLAFGLCGNAFFGPSRAVPGQGGRERPGVRAPGREHRNTEEADSSVHILLELSGFFCEIEQILLKLGIPVDSRLGFFSP